MLVPIADGNQCSQKLLEYVWEMTPAAQAVLRIGARHSLCREPTVNGKPLVKIYRLVKWRLCTVSAQIGVDGTNPIGLQNAHGKTVMDAVHARIVDFVASPKPCWASM